MIYRGVIAASVTGSSLGYMIYRGVIAASVAGSSLG